MEVSHLKIYTNAKIYVEREVFQTTMVVDGGVILAIGGEELISEYPRATIIDSEGKTIVPGLNDSHLHFLQTAEYLTLLPLSTITSMQELITCVKSEIEEKQLGEGDVFYTEGWNHTQFTDEKRIPIREDLDKASKEVPIVLVRVDRHVWSLNSKALEYFGISKETPTPEGGEILRDETGEPTGVFTERAIDLLRPKLPAFTKEEKKEALKQAMYVANSQGLTSMHTNDAKDETIDEVFALYKELEKEKQLSIRFYHQVWFNDGKYIQEFLDKGYTFREGTDFNRVGPVKLFSDGTLGSRTAAMRQDYADDPGNRGVATKSQEELNDEVKVAVDNGFQVIIHGIGDKGIERILDAYDFALEGAPNELRLGVNHMQICEPDLAERVIERDYLTYVQPIFLDDDLPIVEERLGKELAETSYPFGTLARAGVHQSFSSDAPIVSFNPWENIYCALTRKRLNGEPEEGFVPTEAVDIYTAIDAYTYEGAYASFEEEKKGRLKEGYFADFIILDRDIFTCSAEEIKETVVLETIVNGETVYKEKSDG
jgi:hypothetical protein